jgi:hypothetical protein
MCVLEQGAPDVSKEGNSFVKPKRLTRFFATKRHIPEDKNTQLYHYESLKTHTAGYFAQKVVFRPGVSLDRHPDSIGSSPIF